MKRLPPEQLGSLVDERVRAAIEYFAERIAHDFNNIITPLLAYPDMLVSMVADEQSVKLIRSMQEAAEHALGVTQQLAALAGGGQQGPAEFDMCAVARAAVAAVRGQLEAVAPIEIRDRLEEVLPVTMQQEAFVRALEVLLENAIRAVDSSGKGGSITVVAERVRVDCLAGVGGERIPEGVYHMLTVTDTGPGVTPEEMPFIIEPFVTGLIRRPGCGAGLGLSVAYCGLRRNGAYLQIESVAGEGTRAAMYVPVIRVAGADNVSQHQSLQPASAVTASRTQAISTASICAEEKCSDEGGEVQRVLVVDDERTIVNLFKMILENFIPGVVVDRADNGEEALEMFKAKRYPVLVMDLHMPVMDGQSAFFEMENYCQSQGLRMPSVVFCTGYAPQAPLRQVVAEHPRHLLLNKPVQSAALVQAVRERLESVSDV